MNSALRGNSTAIGQLSREAPEVLKKYTRYERKHKRSSTKIT